MSDEWEEQLEYYSKWGEQEQCGMTIPVCNRCGAVVGWDERDTHDEWHAKLEAVLRG